MHETVYVLGVCTVRILSADALTHVYLCNCKAQHAAAWAGGLQIVQPLDWHQKACMVFS